MKQPMQTQKILNVHNFRFREKQLDQSITKSQTPHPLLSHFYCLLSYSRSYHTDYFQPESQSQKYVQASKIK